MAHELWQERFYNHREPAWHGLGITNSTGEKLGAVDALGRLGSFNIRTEDLSMRDGTPVDWKAIVREKSTNWQGLSSPEKVLNVVGKDYQPIGPVDTCSIYDLAVGLPVETLGVLSDGATLFITVELPKWDVKGDEIQDYLSIVNPMDGKRAARILRTPVRIVCANTAVMAELAGSIEYKVRHDVNAAKNLHAWLESAWKKIANDTVMVKEACEILANYYPTDEEVKTLLDSVYPEPRPIRNTAPAEVLKIRAENRMMVAERQQVNRTQVAALFGGEGIGMDSVAAKGTAWGLVQAVTQFEDYRWGKSALEAVESAVFGARAEVKKYAFELAMDIARKEG